MHNPIYTRCRWLLGARILALAIAMVAAAACEASPPPEKPPPDQVLAGAGDIGACGAAGQRNAGATAALLDAIPGTVITLGDNAYEDGTVAEFAQCYDPTWGHLKARTRPAVGNHDYHTPGGAAYHAYFGAAAGEPGKGYYSYDVGAWHIVVINSNCPQVGGCEAGSAQGQWLRADLAAHPARCTLAYWHHPLFTSGGNGNSDFMRPIWQALYEAGADVVLNGHDHDYERFALQDPSGAPDPARGIREIVAGTGGGDLTWRWESNQPNSEVRNKDTHGVIKLTLHAGSYDWEFIPIAGETFTDSGSGSCHGATPPKRG